MMKILNISALCAMLAISGCDFSGMTDQANGASSAAPMALTEDQLSTGIAPLVKICADYAATGEFDKKQLLDRRFKESVAMWGVRSYRTKPSAGFPGTIYMFFEPEIRECTISTDMVVGAIAPYSDFVSREITKQGYTRRYSTHIKPGQLLYTKGSNRLSLTRSVHSGSGENDRVRMAFKPD